MPMVTVRTSSLYWRIMLSVARTSSVRCKGVSLSSDGRPAPDGAWLGGRQKDVLMLDVGLDLAVPTEPFELRADRLRREVLRDHGLHYHGKPRGVEPCVQVNNVHAVRGEAAGDAVN